MLSKVDHEVGDVVLERIKSNPRIPIDIDFADLQEASKRGKDRKTFRNEFTRERIQDSINAASVRDFHDLICKLKSSRIQNMRHSHIAKHCAFLNAPGRGKDFQAKTLSDLNGCHTDATGTGMDQDAFTLLHSRQFIQCVVGGQENGRQCCSVIE